MSWQNWFIWSFSVYLHCSKPTEAAIIKLWNARWRHFQPIRARLSRNPLSRNTPPPLYFKIFEAVPPNVHHRSRVLLKALNAQRPNISCLCQIRPVWEASLFWSFLFINQSVRSSVHPRCKIFSKFPFICERWDFVCDPSRLVCDLNVQNFCI